MFLQASLMRFVIVSTVEKISTEAARRAVPLRSQSVLFLCCTAHVLLADIVESTLLCLMMYNVM